MIIENEENSFSVICDDCGENIGDFNSRIEADEYEDEIMDDEGNILCDDCMRQND